MFKPHKGICSCHGLERWVLNKKGECNETISANKVKKSISLRFNTGKKINDKGTNKRSIPIGVPKTRKTWIHKTKRSTPKKTKKATGEALLFKAIWEEACNKEGTPRCKVCQEPLGNEPKSFYFSHVLAKQTYKLFRLWAPNIWLCCFDCHREWDQGDRSQPKFAEKRSYAEKLKSFYYRIKDIVGFVLPEKFN